jgi:hypothetical protein
MYQQFVRHNVATGWRARRWLSPQTVRLVHVVPALNYLLPGHAAQAYAAISVLGGVDRTQLHALVGPVSAHPTFQSSQDTQLHPPIARCHAAAALAWPAMITTNEGRALECFASRPDRAVSLPRN